MPTLPSMEPKETFVLSDKNFAIDAKQMTPDTLWALKRSTIQSKILAGTGIAASSILLLPTFDISSLGLAYSSRAVNIAPRKLRIAQAELERRNLPRWQKTKRNYGIPLVMTFTVAPFAKDLDELGVPASEAIQRYADQHLEERKTAQGRVSDTKHQPQQMAYAAKLSQDPSVQFIFLRKDGHPITQIITTAGCHHTSDKRACRFCEASISPDEDAFYHCCECSSAGIYDICEVCVAGRGCGCKHATEHDLLRQGKLSSVVQYGNLR